MGTDETLHLLATCYYRAGKSVAAYSILSRKQCKSARCRLLLARCCVDLKKYSEAEEALLCSFVQYDSKLSSKCVVSTDELVDEFGESASFAAQLLATVCAKTERHAKAIDYYKKSLKLNPFLWSSFESLIALGVKIDPARTFDVSATNFNLCHGCNPLINLWNSSKLSESGFNTQTMQTPINNLQGKFEINSPFAVLKSSTESATLDIVTPDNNSWTALSMPPKPPAKAPRKNYLGSLSENSPTTVVMRTETPTGVVNRLSFGVFPLNDSLSMPLSNPITPTEFVEPKSAPSDNKMARAPAKRHHTRRSQQTQSATTRQAPKTQIFSQSGNINSDTVMQTASVGHHMQATSQSGLSLRRSSRLFNSSSSVKENSTKSKARNQENNKGATTINTPSKKTRKQSTSSATITTSNTNATIQTKESEMNELNKPEVAKPSSEELLQTGLKMQKQSAEGLMKLLIELGKAMLHLGQFQAQKTIEILRMLPLKHAQSGWVLAALGRAYFELGNYEESCNCFEAAHAIEPHRVQGMECYSTALWHLQREVKLSQLAQELVDYDKDAPQTWCVAGNCFSLQKEHETAIKFLQRAIQVDSEFAYAYTLLGHELVLTEEMDHAMACFRNAIRIDPRHYNSWYGIGMICFKQEKYQLAEIHYRKAIDISPNNPVLMCHLGVVQHALKKTELALQTLDKAIEMDPKNALCKFQRASFYCAMDKHQAALEELEELKQLVPKESLVYFLIGKVISALSV